MQGNFLIFFIGNKYPFGTAAPVATFYSTGRELWNIVRWLEFQKYATIYHV